MLDATSWRILRVARQGAQNAPGRGAQRLAERVPVEVDEIGLGLDEAVAVDGERIGPIELGGARGCAVIVHAPLSQTIPREPPGRGRCRSSTTTDETTTADDPADVRLAQTGDRDAFARLVARHGAAATRAAAWFGAGPDTDDVVQEAFVKAWQAMGRFREDAPFLPWLLRIVANQTRNEVRSRKRRDARALRALDPGGVLTDPTADAEAHERDAAVLSAVRSLRSDERDVVVCRWFLGLSEQETATALGIPRGTAKSRSSRALTRLRAGLAPLDAAAEVDDARG